MSGKIEFKIRRGKAILPSFDKKFGGYPEWYIICHDEFDDKKTVKLSPKVKEIGKLIGKIIKHERAIDSYKLRINDHHYQRIVLESYFKEGKDGDISEFLKELKKLEVNKK